MKQFLILTPQNNRGSQYSPNGHFICSEADSMEEAQVLLTFIKHDFSDAYILDALALNQDMG